MALLYKYRAEINPNNIRDRICNVRVTSDNKYVLSSGPLLTLTRLDNGEFVRDLSVFGHEICLTRDNQYVLTNGFFRMSADITIACLNTGKPVRVIKEHKVNIPNPNPVNDLVQCHFYEFCVSPDNKYVLFTSSEDNIIRVTCFDSGKLLRLIHTPTDIQIDKLYVSPNNKYVVSVSNQKIRITLLQNGNLVRLIELPAEQDILSVCVTPNSKYLVYSTRSYGRVELLDNGELFSVVKSYIRIERLDNGKLISVNKGIKPVWKVLVTPDNNHLVSQFRKTIQITRLNNGRLVTKFEVSSKINDFCLSSDGERLVAGCEDNSICVFAMPTYLLKHQWAQVLLWKKDFKIFHQYPGLMRYIGNRLLLFC